MKRGRFRLGSGQDSLGLLLGRLKPLFKTGLGLGVALLLGLSHNLLGLLTGCLETGLGLLTSCLKPASHLCLFLVDSRQG
jgi:hypothetical protein